MDLNESFSTLSESFTIDPVDVTSDFIINADGSSKKKFQPIKYEDEPFSGSFDDNTYSDDDNKNTSEIDEADMSFNEFSRVESNVNSSVGDSNDAERETSLLRSPVRKSTVIEDSFKPSSPARRYFQNERVSTQVPRSLTARINAQLSPQSERPMDSNSKSLTDRSSRSRISSKLAPPSELVSRKSDSKARPSGAKPIVQSFEKDNHSNSCENSDSDISEIDNGDISRIANVETVPIPEPHVEEVKESASVEEQSVPAIESAPVITLSNLSPVEAQLATIVQGKVRALHEQMNEYSAAVARLQSERRLLQEERRQQERQRAALDLDRVALREWREAEAAKLAQAKEDLKSLIAKERRVAFRQARAEMSVATALPVRASRAELEQLRAENSRLQAELSAQTRLSEGLRVRHKSAVERLQSQIEELQGRIKSYEADRIALVFGQEALDLHGSASFPKFSQSGAAVESPETLGKKVNSRVKRSSESAQSDMSKKLTTNSRSDHSESLRTRLGEEHPAVPLKSSLKVGSLSQRSTRILIDENNPRSAEHHEVDNQEAGTQWMDQEPVYDPTVYADEEDEFERSQLMNHDNNFTKGFNSQQLLRNSIRAGISVSRGSMEGKSAGNVNHEFRGNNHGPDTVNVKKRVSPALASVGMYADFQPSETGTTKSTATMEKSATETTNSKTITVTSAMSRYGNTISVPQGSVATNALISGSSKEAEVIKEHVSWVTSADMSPQLQNHRNSSEVLLENLPHLMSPPDTVIVHQSVDPEGVTLTTFADGSELAHHRNGSLRLYRTDGSVVVKYPNGDVRLVLEGRDAYYYASARAVHTQYLRRGVRNPILDKGKDRKYTLAEVLFDVYEYEGGQIELHRNGTKEIFSE